MEETVSSRMKIDAILFDVNGTLTDILTDEGKPEIYRTLQDFLRYRGIRLRKSEIHSLYFRYMKEQQERSSEEHPEFDAVKIFQRIMEERPYSLQSSSPSERLAPILADLFRTASLCKELHTYPNVREVIQSLQRYRMGVVSDGQRAWARAELEAVDLLEHFHPVIVSGDFGFRKPDRRLFERALEILEVEPQNAVFVGNDMYRDVYGAKQVGMRSIFFRSNQGDHESRGVEPDYIIYEFAQLPVAVEFLENKETPAC